MEVITMEVTGPLETLAQLAAGDVKTFVIPSDPGTVWLLTNIRQESAPGSGQFNRGYVRLTDGHYGYAFENTPVIPVVYEAKPKA